MGYGTPGWAYARIAELKKENEKLQKQIKELEEELNALRTSP